MFFEAAKAAAFRVIGYFFEIALREALARNAERSGAAIIPVPGVIGTYKRLERPALEEGFHELYLVSHEKQSRFAVNSMPAASSKQSR